MASIIFSKLNLYGRQIIQVNLESLTGKNTIYKSKCNFKTYEKYKYR
jgi:hypothetical protein